MSSKIVFGLIAVMFVLMCLLYIKLSGLVLPAIVAAVVMLIVGFFFATVSGNLVGFIGSSNNPISGLTLSTLTDRGAADGRPGSFGHRESPQCLGVAAVVCVSSAVAGELLQDFKVGYILGGTPQKIQIAELIAVVVASLVMYFPLMLLHEGNIRAGGVGFGDPELPAPQAGLMATLAMGIVGARHGMAAGGGRNSFRHRHDHDAGEKPDAGRGRHVSAVRHDLRNFCGRRHSARSAIGSPSAAASTQHKKPA